MDPLWKRFLPFLNFTTSNQLHTKRAQNTVDTRHKTQNESSQMEFCSKHYLQINGIINALKRLSIQSSHVAKSAALVFCRQKKLPLFLPTWLTCRLSCRFTLRILHLGKWDCISGSTISTLLHDRINPKDCQVLSLGDTGFLQFFRVVSRDYGKPRIWP